MFRNRRRTRVARVTLAGAAAVLAVAGIAACTSSSGTAAGGGPSPSATASPVGPAVPGGTVREALPAGARLDYIFPFTPRAKQSEYNSGYFQLLMYRPLYMFGGNGTSVVVNYPLSVADAPTYSDGGKTVTITMKGWKWSDGETVDASDVIFWLNMMKAEPAGYYGYVPGLLPDNLASYRATSASTVVLHLRSAVSGIWFTYNQLAEITPMPAAWDVTAAGSAAGSGGCAADSAADNWARCAAVYRFLAAAAANAKDYATSPVWGVADGPWKLSSFSAAAAAAGPVASFVPNDAYSGSPKPQIDTLSYFAYSSDAAEYTALKSGHLDVGSIPLPDLPPLSSGQVLPPVSPLGSGFTLAPNLGFGIQYFYLNFGNPALGPAYKQLYVREAIQESVDQEGMIRSVDRGYGYPTSGGVPAEPQSGWVPSVQYQNGGQGPYAFSTANAMLLLTSHGWRETGGVMTCQAAGTGAARCGAGVKAGTRLSMTLDYAAGRQPVTAEAAIMKSDMGSAGIALSLVPRAVTAAGWDLRYVSGWDFSGPGFQPTGEPLFATGASANPGSYSDPETDKLVGLTHTSGSLSVFQQYAAYLADQLPVIWIPSTYRVQAVSARLAGVAFSPLATTLPEYWYFTS